MNVVGGGLASVPVLVIACDNSGGGGRGKDESGTVGAKVGAGAIHHESRFRVCQF
jgi:hypothetical protein